MLKDYGWPSFWQVAVGVQEQKPATFGGEGRRSLLCATTFRRGQKCSAGLNRYLLRIVRRSAIGEDHLTYEAAYHAFQKLREQSGQVMARIVGRDDDRNWCSHDLYLLPKLSAKGKFVAVGFEAERAVLALKGADCAQFLQDMVSNDVSGGGLVYTALLTPQGKYLFDFFVFERDGVWFIDVAAARGAALTQRLGMYKLRADVTIEASDLRVFQLWESELGDLDPRGEALGRRYYAQEAPEMGRGPDWDALRVEHLVPETDIELIADDSYILECGFERLAGVDFKKGCYVGQEVTARMKHKTELRKGLARVSIAGQVEPGAPIMAGEREVGVLHTVSGGFGIAYLRFDRAKGEMRAGEAVVQLI